MKCMQGFDIKKKDEKDPNARLDPFVKFRLGRWSLIYAIRYAYSVCYVMLCMCVGFVSQV